MLSLPYLLILFRLLCAPTMLVLAWHQGTSATAPILLLMHLGLWSDVFDGIIARRQGGQTELMRRCDSQTDVIFWLSVAIVAWRLHPQAMWTELPAIGAVLMMEAACYAVSIWKFGKESCTHAWLAKFWAITMVVAFTRLIGWGEARGSFQFAVVCGLIAHVDVIVITLLLPEWQHDVPSSYHAWLVRRGIPFRKHRLLNG